MVRLDAMRLPMFVPIAASVAGAVVWAFAKVTELGSVTGESTDPSQRARIFAPVPEWIGIAKPLGLTLLVAGGLAAGVSWAAKKEAAGVADPDAGSAHLPPR